MDAVAFLIIVFLKFLLTHASHGGGDEPSPEINYSGYERSPETYTSVPKETTKSTKETFVTSYVTEPIPSIEYPGVDNSKEVNGK